MHRFVVLVVFGIASVMAIKEECLKLGHPRAMQCCKTPPPPPPRDESIKECFEKLGKPPKPPAAPTCELDICIAKKKGYASDDGTLDKKALEAHVAENFKDSPELIESITKNCVNGDVKDYGREDFCDLMKITHCVHVQLAMACPEYTDKGHCSEMKELAEKCAAE